MSGDCPRFIGFISKSGTFVPQIIELLAYQYDSLKTTCLWTLNFLKFA